MSPNPVTCERLSDLVSQLSACAEELEDFATCQLDEIDALHRRLAGAQPRHPHQDDPVVAAVLEQFAPLESKL